MVASTVSIVGVYGRSSYTVIVWSDEEGAYHETVVEYESHGKDKGRSRIIRGPACPAVPGLS